MVRICIDIIYIFVLNNGGIQIGKQHDKPKKSKHYDIELVLKEYPCHRLPVGIAGSGYLFSLYLRDIVVSKQFLVREIEFR